LKTKLIFRLPVFYQKTSKPTCIFPSISVLKSTFIIMRIRLLPVVLCLFFSSFVFSQEKIIPGKPPKDWWQKDYTTDKFRGVSVDKAYEFLKGKTSRPIIVAVIDGGVEAKHEDLKDKMWVNTKETAGNNLDDDKNGYADDINGWNFIGGKDGKNVGRDNLEMTRELVRLKKKFADMPQKKLAKLKGKNKADYEELQKVQKAYDAKKAEYEGYFPMYKMMVGMLDRSKDILKAHLKKDTLLKEDVEAIKTDDVQVNAAKEGYLGMLEKVPEKDLREGYEQLNSILNYGLNPDFDPRNIVGDNYADKTEKFYGNGIVQGPEGHTGDHGTHVAGIIGANRNNDLGIKGICENVQIMGVRTVPDGDERDKDVANSIRYAADNGARIMNMSFGKDFSPERPVVDEAIKYAASKGVLMIHAAGNDKKNNDTDENYPTNKFANVSTWVEVGASAWGDDQDFVADFSNYGKTTVHVFAPGKDIYSSVSGSQYEYLSGTSMAAPVVAGVAALLWSYYPNLTAEQVKDILMKSSVKYVGKKVNKPSEDGGSINFEELSISGGIVNAYEAVKMAEGMAK
jgi:cell wall-associated protease